MSGSVIPLQKGMFSIVNTFQAEGLVHGGSSQRIKTEQLRWFLRRHNNCRGAIYWYFIRLSGWESIAKCVYEELVNVRETFWNMQHGDILRINTLISLISAVHRIFKNLPLISRCSGEGNYSLGDYKIFHILLLRGTTGCIFFNPAFPYASFWSSLKKSFENSTGTFAADRLHEPILGCFPG